MIKNAPDALEKKYEAVVVGAGAAGGVLAKELTDKGIKVALIEAGPYLEQKDFLPFEQIYQSQRFWSGGLEPDRGLKIIFVRGKGVGGTTLVNQCLIDRCKPWVFEDWRTVSGKKEFNSEEMNKWYGKVEDEMNLEIMTDDDFNGNNSKMVEGFEKCGLSWRHLRRGQTHCEDCIHCLGGCPLGSKQGTNMTFIPKAVDGGAEVISGYEIDSVELSKSDRPHKINMIAEDGSKLQMVAPTLVLSAGTFGTAGIMLRSGLKKELPAVGENFACHPQKLVFGEFDEELDMCDGAFQAAAPDEEDLYRKGVKFEVVGFPPITAAVSFGDFGQSLKDKMRKLNRYGVLECAIRDDGAGRISINRKGRLVIDKPYTDDDQAKFKLGTEIMSNIITAAGAKKLEFLEMEVGLHLQSSCRMGAHPSTSVVDHDWQIHGYKNAYISDASVFPTSTGFNVMGTVMAQAAMAAEAIAGKAKQ